MENDTANPPYITINERLAVLEIKHDILAKEVTDMSGKLDQLLELKSKGMGAVWLIGLLIGGGAMTAVGFITQFFNRGHL